MFAGNARSLEDTLQIVNHRELIGSGNALAKAPRLLFFGIGSSGYLAQDAALRFSQLCIPAEAYFDAYQVLVHGTYLKKGEAAIGISHSGRSAITVKALDLAHRGGVKLVYGTDLLGAMHKDQLSEFALRSEVQAPIDIIRSATSTAAELFNEVGQTGVVAAGARADLLVVDGDPLQDLRCLQAPERYVKAIIKDGMFCKNAL